MERTKPVFRYLLRKRLAADEQGMTMIEMLTALVLLSMIVLLLTSFLLMGISMYQRATAVNQIRNQGDALIGQIISELKDAVYVSKGSKDNSITFVKRSTDPAKYAEAYTMEFEKLTDGRYGIEIRDSADNPVRHLTLTTPYTLKREPTASDPDLSTIEVKNNYLVEVHLFYEKAPDNPSKAALNENPSYEIDTQIPLFRSE